MLDFLLRSEDGWALQHMKAALVALQGFLLLILGPDKFFSSLHKIMRPPLIIFGVATLIWIIISIVWMRIAESAAWTDRVTIVTLSIMCGVTFFATKAFRPITYGVIELMAGILGMSVVAFVDWDQPAIVLIFAGASSIYIVVRGLTNINDGLLRADQALELEKSKVIEDDGLEPWEFPPEQPEANSDAPAAR